MQIKIQVRNIQPHDMRPCVFWVRSDNQGFFDMQNAPAWEARQELLHECVDDVQREEILSGIMHLEMR